MNSASSVVSSAEANLTALETEKTKILAALQEHINSHQAIVDRHSAEIGFAREMIARAAPKSSDTPEFVLTKINQPAKPGLGWRAWVGLGMGLAIVTGLIFIK